MVDKNFTSTFELYNRVPVLYHILLLYLCSIYFTEFLYSLHCIVSCCSVLCCVFRLYCTVLYYAVSMTDPECTCRPG